MNNQASRIITPQSPRQAQILDAEQRCIDAVNEICLKYNVRIAAEIVMVPPAPPQSTILILTSEQQKDPSAPLTTDMDRRIRLAGEEMDAATKRYDCLGLALMKVSSTGSFDCIPVFYHQDRIKYALQGQVQAVEKMISVGHIN